MVYKTELGKDGYVICKVDHQQDRLQAVRNELTVAPKINAQFDFQPVRSFPVYRETNNRMLLPRHYGVEKFGPPTNLSFPDVEILPALQAQIQLRESQLPIAAAAMKAFHTDGGGILQLYTGAGKTVLALYLICQLKVKTLIVVHKSVLLAQWKERILEFIPQARVGLIQAKKIDVEDKDIIIASLQSLAMKEYDPGLLDDIQFLVGDEIHHFAAEVFSRALPKVGAKFNLGLSATPDRKDGLTKVFKWYMGGVIYRLERESPQTVVKRVVYHSDSAAYCQEKRNFRGTIMLPTMINNIVAHHPRNQVILHEVAYYLQEDTRQIMVMGDRIVHLENLHQAFLAQGTQIKRDNQTRPATAGLYIGKMKQAQLEESARKDVIFASSAICREGLDIASLNTLVLATPVGDVVQASGRIMRKAHELCPLIIDIVDSFSIFHGQARKRAKFYAKSKFCQYTVHHTEGTSLQPLETSVQDMLGDQSSSECGSDEQDDVPASNSDTAAPDVAFLADSDED